MAELKFFRVHIFLKDKPGNFHISVRITVGKYKDGLKVSYAKNVKISRDYRDLDKTDISDNVDHMSIHPILKEEYDEGKIYSGRTIFIESVLNDVKQFVVIKLNKTYDFKYTWIIRGDLIIEKGDQNIDSIINQIRYYMRIDNREYIEDDEEEDNTQLKLDYEKLQQKLKDLETEHDEIIKKYEELKTTQVAVETQMKEQEETFNNKIKELDDLYKRQEDTLNQRMEELEASRAKLTEQSHITDEIENAMNDLEKEHQEDQEKLRIQINTLEEEKVKLEEENNKEIEKLNKETEELKEQYNEVTKERNELKDALAKFELTGVNISSWGNPPPEKKSRKSDDSFCYIS